MNHQKQSLFKQLRSLIDELQSPCTSIDYYNSVPINEGTKHTFNGATRDNKTFTITIAERETK
jgi:hypothetical protein